MKIAFQWKGYMEKNVVVSIVKGLEFLPVGQLQGQYTHDAKFNYGQSNKPKEWPSNPLKEYGWPENLAAEFCYTYIYGDYATRNKIDGMPTWDIPEDQVADVVALFCAAGGDARLIDDLLTIKC